MAKRIYHGACQCQQIQYAASNLKPIWYCHCEQCRRMTGNFMAAAQVSLCDIKINGEPNWFYVSTYARYGFCANCGSQLFWRNDNNDYLSVTGGTLNDASGLKVLGHLYTSEKSMYYKIPTDEPSHQSWCELVGKK